MYRKECGGEKLEGSRWASRPAPCTCRADSAADGDDVPADYAVSAEPGPADAGATANGATPNDTDLDDGAPPDDLPAAAASSLQLPNASGLSS